MSQDIKSLTAEVKKLNFMAFIEAHRRWRIRLLAALEGDGKEALSVATVSSDSLCELGKWIHGQAKELFGEDPEYAALVEKHASFHRLVGEVLTLIQSGKIDEARTHLSDSGSLLRASQKVSMEIVRLAQKAKEL